MRCASKFPRDRSEYIGWFVRGFLNIGQLHRCRGCARIKLTDPEWRPVWFPIFFTSFPWVFNLINILLSKIAYLFIHHSIHSFIPQKNVLRNAKRQAIQDSVFCVYASWMKTNFDITHDTIFYIAKSIANHKTFENPRQVKRFIRQNKLTCTLGQNCTK